MILKLFLSLGFAWLGFPLIAQSDVDSHNTEEPIPVESLGAVEVPKEVEQTILSQTEDRYTYDGLKIVGPSPTISSESSKVQRENKQHMLEISIGAYILELQYGFFWNPDTLIEIHANYQRDLFYSDIISATVGIGVLTFLSEDFFMQSGLAGRYHEHPAYQITSLNKLAKIQEFDFGLEFALGHKYQFETFNWGVKWIGFYVPLIGEEGLANGATVQMRLLNFSLGMSF